MLLSRVICYLWIDNRHTDRGPKYLCFAKYFNLFKNALFELKYLYYTRCFCILISFRENSRQRLLRKLMEFLDPSGSIILKGTRFVATCTRLQINGNSNIM
jgi:hypothetical protein